MGVEITELVTKFSFAGDTSPLKGYNQSLGKSIKLLAGFGAAAVAASAGIHRWAEGILETIDPTVQLSRATGVAFEDIQRLGYIASVNGSSVGAMEGSLERLAGTIGEAAMGMGMGKKAFEELGLSMRDSEGKVKSAAVVFDELRQKFHELGTSDSEKIGFAKKLGIDKSLVQVLSRTDKEMEGLNKRVRELGFLTREQGDAAAAYNDSATTMTTAMDNIKKQVASSLAPEMQKFNEFFTEMIIENKDDIISFAETFAKAVSSIAASIGRMIPVLGILAGGFVVAKIATLGFTGALAALFSPAILIAAAIAAAWVVVDDFLVGIAGGESFIRDFFSAFFDYDIVNLWGDIKDAASKALTYIGNMLRDLFPDWLIKLLEGDISSIGGGKKITIGAERVSRAGSQASLTDNRQVNQKVEINVKSTQPEAAARAVDNGLQRQLSNAQSQLKSGGR